MYSIEHMTLGTGQYVQEMIVEGVAPGTVCRGGGLWRVGELVVCAGEECVGYNSRHYVQQESVEGMTVGIMCRRGVWSVQQQEVYAKEECEGDGSVSIFFIFYYFLFFYCVKSPIGGGEALVEISWV